MPRTNAKAVIDILLDNYGPNEAGEFPSLAPFIEAAASLMDDVIDCATGKGITLTTAKREILERWLAAYFYTKGDRQFASKTTAAASASYVLDPKVPESYAKAALDLDPSGCLETLLGAGGMRAGGFWAGKVPGDQIDYDDRVSG